MKKGVVLLITLFFIMAISVLVLKNLDDTDKFLENEYYISNNSQVLISIKNTQKEVSKLLVKYKDRVDEALANEIFTSDIPIDIKELNIKFRINKSDKVDVNEINKKDSKVVENLFIENEIFDYYIFEEIYKEKLQGSNQKIETSKQLDDIIFTFIKRVEDNKIDSIKDYLGFVAQANMYELYVDVTYLSSKAFAYYLLDDEGKVKYFDISFK